MGIEAIQGVQSLLQGVDPASTAAGAAPTGRSFKDVLADAIHDVDQAQHVADDKLARMASGEEINIHGTMIALQEADISVRLLMSVRSKVLDAYQQIMNMNL